MPMSSPPSWLSSSPSSSSFQIFFFLFRTLNSSVTIFKFKSAQQNPCPLPNKTPIAARGHAKEAHGYRRHAMQQMGADDFMINLILRFTGEFEKKTKNAGNAKEGENMKLKKMEQVVRKYKNKKVRKKIIFSASVVKK